jgi:hypothetical protein
MGNIVIDTTRTTGFFGTTGTTLPGLPSLPRPGHGRQGRNTRANPTRNPGDLSRQPSRIDGSPTCCCLRGVPMTMLPKRHHLLLAGLLLFFIGVKFRLVESFTLNERSSRFVAAQLGDGGRPPLWQSLPLRKVVEPPRWLGLALMSAGAVITIKSLSMKDG